MTVQNTSVVLLDIITHDNSSTIVLQVNTDLLVKKFNFKNVLSTEEGQSLKKMLKLLCKENNIPFSSIKVSNWKAKYSETGNILISFDINTKLKSIIKMDEDYCNYDNIFVI